MSYHRLIKLIIVGNTMVGKSNIMTSFTENLFYANGDATIGVEFASKIVSYNNKQYKLHIWDTAGQEIYRSITNSYYRGADACFIVYSITDRSSFNEVLSWLQTCKNMNNKKMVIILIGNKNDNTNNRQVSYAEGQKLADENSLVFFETSAKTSHNINKCFLNIIENFDKTDLIDVILNDVKLNEEALNNTYSDWCCYATRK